MHRVHESLTSLLIDVDLLVPLPGNPRIGDTEAIAASLEEFGQLKPVVVKANDDGTATIIAGNHTVEAARQLGWTHVAAVSVSDMDDKRARAFALTDNRINELGSTNEELLYQSLTTIADEYQDYLEILGWDEFELASMDEQAYAIEHTEPGGGFVPPVLVPRQEPPAPPQRNMTEGKTTPSHIEAPASINTQDVAARGAATMGQGGANVVVQYTLVFDSVDQQRRWYDFIRWVKSDPGTDGATTAERLMNFLDAHANF
jgi:hypothetical protein